MTGRNILLKKQYMLLSALEDFSFLKLSMPENLVMTSACARPSARTDSCSRGKKLSREWNRVLDMYVAFHFGAKLTHLGGTNGVARVIN